MAELLMRQGVKQKIPKRYQAPVQEFVKVALERYGGRIERILLFGSVARGEATEESDIDILIVTKNEDFRLRRELIGVAFDILLDTGENISVKALSKDGFERHKNFSFVQSIILEGVKVA